mmetsp:Transcript_122833/g.358501  ORF Transcript_122833/g.358501 Transcript_122833/m.358501 type:complete len:93 (+) Transcript_122833:150-428(+)
MASAMAGICTSMDALYAMQAQASLASAISLLTYPHPWGDSAFHPSSIEGNGRATVSLSASSLAAILGNVSGPATAGNEWHQDFPWRHSHTAQ